jgi:hypothetical protein
MTANAFAWGAAIGAAALVGYFAARQVRGLALPAPVCAPAMLAAAFVGYEAGLYAAAVVLGGTGTAFTGAIVGYVLVINAVAFAGLLIVERAATLLSLKPAPAAA